MLPEFVQSVKKVVQSEIGNLHTAFPGKIVSYDSSTGLAVVQPSMKYKKPDGEKVDYPQIYGVPVLLQQSNSQKATITVPVKPDDGCLVLCSEESIEYWLYEQETDTTLKHDLTNAVCIPGLFNKPNDVFQEAFDNDKIILDLDGKRISVAKDKIELDLSGTKITISDGTVKINGSNINLVGTTTISNYPDLIELEGRVAALEARI